MPRLIRLQDVDQFAEVVRIPEGAVSDTVLGGVRELDERRELEPALREILFDPNETPHGPTEIADVLTSRVIVRGERRLGAFVLKGKSFPQVSSRKVAHQFAKLRTVPDLGLAVFMAVGHIQDDAQRDFVQMALDAKTDYLIVDAVDCARLLIAYEKICPIDGLIFGPDGACGNGHHLDPGAKLEVPVRGDLYFEVPRLEDLSHRGAKRYSAVVMVDRHASRETLREVIRRSLPVVRASDHHRSDLIRRVWGGVDAHVVWLYLAGTLEDVRHANWVARAQWIDPSLDDSMGPLRLGGDEWQDGVEIAWNAQHSMMRGFYQANAGAKAPLLREIRVLVQRSRPLAEAAAAAMRALDDDSLSEDAFDAALEELHDPINQIVNESGALPFPPEDLKELDTAAQGLFGSLGSVSICYLEMARGKWTHSQRVTLIRMALQDFARGLARVEQELARIR